MDATRARASPTRSVTRASDRLVRALYREGRGWLDGRPLADLVPNPHLVAWLDHAPARAGPRARRRHGFGDNAEELARRGQSRQRVRLSATGDLACARAVPHQRRSPTPCRSVAPPAAWARSVRPISPNLHAAGFCRRRRGARRPAQSPRCRGRGRAARHRARRDPGSRGGDAVAAHARRGRIDRAATAWVLERFDDFSTTRGRRAALRRGFRRR